MEEYQYENVSRICRALGDATRLRILKSIWDGPASVTQIVETTAVPQTAVSRNLAVLHAVGLVMRRRVGVNVIYSIADPALKVILSHTIDLEREISGARVGNR
jgi:DNA-binding transcriptional ArsR family regulator